MIVSRNFCKKVLRTCNLSHAITKHPTPVGNARLVHTTRWQNAGHSHWENIRHIKSAKDEARSKVFCGLAKRIASVIKEGGNDPKKNAELARVVKMCKSNNMPRSTLEKCLNAKHDLQEYIYGVSGPGGSSLLVTCQSTTTLNSKHGMIHAFKMSNLNGALDQTKLDEFSRKQVILVDIGIMDINDDSATEIALDIGAEDVNVLKEDSGSLLEFICDARGFAAVEKEIESKGLEIISSKLEYLPNNLVDLTESDHSSIEMFLTALRKTSEKSEIVFSVTDVFHNINVQH